MQKSPCFAFVRSRAFSFRPNQKFISTTIFFI